MMAGGAVTGAIAMAFDAQSRAPHGGIFVFFAMSNVLAFVGAIVAGMLVSATLVILAKEFVGRTADEPAEDVAVAAV